MISRDSDRFTQLYRQRSGVERAFSRLKQHRALTALRARGLDRVQLHAELAILATLVAGVADAPGTSTFPGRACTYTPPARGRGKSLPAFLGEVALGLLSTLTMVMPFGAVIGWAPGALIFGPESTGAIVTACVGAALALLAAGDALVRDVRRFARDFR